MRNVMARVGLAAILAVGVSATIAAQEAAAPAPTPNLKDPSTLALNCTFDVAICCISFVTLLYLLCAWVRISEICSCMLRMLREFVSRMLLSSDCRWATSLFRAFPSRVATFAVCFACVASCAVLSICCTTSFACRSACCEDDAADDAMLAASAALSFANLVADEMSLNIALAC